ncbi:MAG: 2-oxoacid:acceptor oxidoreductase subunit alpha [Candidatus Caenarcaniphilales bacterium]|jgi:2-oxoglutarate ferredoxin oxidoreductase subunit alpha|nr:2-oxoacid:acceptor oxidoreductase subunit alpha [Candidatus Caenarcaniphilales bacterium]
MSNKNRVIVRIAGAAGDGIASTGEMLGKTCSRMGLHVLAYNSFQSAIRGGHVWLQMAIGPDQQNCHADQPELILLFNKTSPAVHVPDAKPGAIIFYNADTIKKEDIESIRSDVSFYGLSFKAMVDEAGLTGVAPIMINTMLSGALIQTIDLDVNIPLDIIKHRFTKKGQQVVDLNQAIFNLGANWVKGNVKSNFPKLVGSGNPKMFMTGNEALGLGLVAGGLKLYSAYPMSPATGILHYLATIAQKDKIVIKQVEDELAAMNMVVGAGTAGVRAATATASGGYCLMIEAVGLASMLETPAVCIVVSRGGPSTGVPTKQEQSDIDLAIAGNGDSPRFVLAPKTPEDCFYQAARALNMAEKYQIPVIVLSDFFLSEHFETIDNLDFSKVTIERGKFSTTWEGQGRYKRYEYTEDGVSHRVRPGAPGAMYVPCSDEHNEFGHVMSDVEAGLPHAREERIKMHAKRMRKMQTMIESGDVNPPTLEGETNAETTFMTWGSSHSFVQEAIDLLAAEGVKVNHLHFTDVYPIPREATLAQIKKCKRIISVEANMCNSMCKQLLAETAFEITEHINRWDGEPLTGEYIVREFKKLGSKKKELVNA